MFYLCNTIQKSAYADRRGLLEDKKHSNSELSVKKFYFGILGKTKKGL